MKYKNIIKNEPRFNGVFSRDNLPKIKDGTYVINLDKYSDIRTHWVALYVHNNNKNNNNNNNNGTYFDSFGVEHITKEIKAFINSNNNSRKKNNNIKKHSNKCF